LRTLWKAWQQYVLPHHAVCALCGSAKNRGKELCPTCEEQLKRQAPPICSRCGRRAEDGVCRNCQTYPPRFSRGGVVFVYDGPVREGIHRLKYAADGAACRYLAGEMAAFLSRWPHTAKIDCMVCVPMHWRRWLARGYNPAGRLTRQISRLTGIPFVPGMLRRIRHQIGRANAGAGAQQRRLLSNNNFCTSAKADCRGKCVLVVDDVITSGATLDACATALLRAGAARVFILAAAGVSHT